MKILRFAYIRFLNSRRCCDIRNKYLDDCWLLKRKYSIHDNLALRGSFFFFSIRGGVATFLNAKKLFGIYCNFSACSSWFLLSIDTVVYVLAVTFYIYIGTLWFDRNSQHSVKILSIEDLFPGPYFSSSVKDKPALYIRSIVIFVLNPILSRHWGLFLLLNYPMLAAFCNPM